MRRKQRESLFEKGRLFDIVALRVRTYSEMALIREVDRVEPVSLRSSYQVLPTKWISLIIFL